MISEFCIKKITKAKIWGLKNLFSLLKFYKWLFLVHSSIGKWGGGGGGEAAKNNKIRHWGFYDLRIVGYKN